MKLHLSEYGNSKNKTPLYHQKIGVGAHFLRGVSYSREILEHVAGIHQINHEEMQNGHFPHDGNKICSLS